MELFTINKNIKTIHIIDKFYQNNGGHNEYYIFKFEIGYKNRSFLFCVVETDIYGKCQTNHFTEEEFRLKFGNHADQILKQLI